MKNWQIKNNKLYKEFKFASFSEAFALVCKISQLAEQQNHHPDIQFGWAYVRVEIFSHDLCEITERDYQLQKSIDQLDL